MVYTSSRNTKNKSLKISINLAQYQNEIIFKNIYRMYSIYVCTLPDIIIMNASYNLVILYSQDTCIME